MSNLVKDSKVWIYQSDRIFSEDEVDSLNQKLANFVKDWSSHNNQLYADYKILYNRFIILIVDENQFGASGCSIDKSIHFLQLIEKEHNINLFNRMLVHYFDSENQLFTISVIDFQKLIQEGKVNADTKVINTTVQNLEALEQDFVLSATNTWLKRYF